MLQSYAKDKHQGRKHPSIQNLTHQGDAFFYEAAIGKLCKHKSCHICPGYFWHTLHSKSFFRNVLACCRGIGEYNRVNQGPVKCTGSY